jgi:hypothetical protein
MKTSVRPRQLFLSTASRRKEARLAVTRIDKNQGRHALMAQKVKNHANAKTSNGDVLASSIRAAHRKPRKPATPSTVTTKSAFSAERDLALRPMPDRMIVEALEIHSSETRKI